MTQSSESNSLMELEDRMRWSIDRVRGQAEQRLRRLSNLIVNKPIRSLGVAFLSGVVLARLLQKLG
jgi:ElaB/YqjD/DUF883 family membrane-anchored ribosome-binding protein